MSTRFLTVVPASPTFIIGCVSASIALALPFVHIGIVHKQLWVPYKPSVDRKHCKCNCFDTVFKGSYTGDLDPRLQRLPKHMRPVVSPGFMHVYFNATGNTLCIWVMTGAGLLLLYEGLRQILSLVYQQRCRALWLVAWLAGLYPNYYGYWALFNYYNEDFYVLFNQQLFFSLTELIMSAVLLSLCDRDTEISAVKTLIVFTLSSVHVIVGMLDQFYVHLFKSDCTKDCAKTVKLYIKSRDVSLLSTDVLILCVSAHALHTLHRKYTFSHRSKCVVCAAVVVGVLTGRHC